jgi:uncharacterized protein (DUF58 family)
MTLDELIKNVKEIDLLTNDISHQKMAGSFDSQFKGKGLSLDAIRKYEAGDDVRDINWNVTARFREPYINTFTENKKRQVWVAMDISCSNTFGSAGKSKLDLQIEIAATLVYSFLKKGDAVGVLFFSDKVEKLVRPSVGMVNFLQIAKAMVSANAQGKQTNINNALRFLITVTQTKTNIFILSDFIDDNYAAIAKAIAVNHSITAIRVFDEREKDMPRLGWLRSRNPESGKTAWVNTSSAKFRESLTEQFNKVEEHFHKTFADCHANAFNISTKDSFVKKLSGIIRNY